MSTQDDEVAGREIRVLIVDDHEVVAASLRMVLDAEPDLSTVGHAGTLEEARRLVASTEPDVVLLDHRLPDGEGSRRSPSCGCCVLASRWWC